MCVFVGEMERKEEMGCDRKEMTKVTARLSSLSCQSTRGDKQEGRDDVATVDSEGRRIQIL